MIRFRPSPKDLLRLKKPLGDLLLGEPKATMPRLALLVEQIRPVRIAAVGDVVSRETLVAGIPVDLRIVDQRSMRMPVSSSDFPARKVYHVRNPAGVITIESLDAIRRAMKEREVVILVDGEEDLLTLPCVVESPDRALVLYGQPSRGLVVLNVTPATKKEATLIMERMTREDTDQPQPT